MLTDQRCYMVMHNAWCNLLLNISFFALVLFLVYLSVKDMHCEVIKELCVWVYVSGGGGRVYSAMFTAFDLHQTKFNPNSTAAIWYYENNFNLSS